MAGCRGPDELPPPVAPRELVDVARSRRATHTRGPLRVGVAWKGSPLNRVDHFRSFSPDQFATVWQRLAGAEFVNLSHDAPVGEAAPFAPAQFSDLHALGDLVASLDLVVTVDTSVAHVAASIGCSA